MCILSGLLWQGLLVSVYMCVYVYIKGMIIRSQEVLHLIIMVNVEGIMRGIFLIRIPGMIVVVVETLL